MKDFYLQIHPDQTRVPDTLVVFFVDVRDEKQWRMRALATCIKLPWVNNKSVRCNI